jgi:hypothetical protein
VEMHLGIAVRGREQHHGRPQLQIKPLAFGVNQPWEDTLAKLARPEAEQGPVRW